MEKLAFRILFGGMVVFLISGGVGISLLVMSELINK